MKRTEFRNHTIYVEMKYIPRLFPCQEYGKTVCIIGCLICVMERFFLSPLKKKKKVILISRLIYTSFPVFYVETFQNSQFPSEVRFPQLINPAFPHDKWPYLIKGHIGK